jgi:hypothetical protein
MGFDLVAERVTAHMFNGLKRPIHRESLALADVRMSKSKNVHACLVAKTKRLVIIPFASLPEYQV